MKELTVSLMGLEFYAQHGWYPEEKILGNRYTVDIDVTILAWKPTDVTDLNQSINYGHLATIAQEIMAVPTDLLESLADAMIARIADLHQGIDRISVTIKKANPPLGTLCQASSVTITFRKDPSL